MSLKQAPSLIPAVRDTRVLPHGRGAIRAPLQRPSIMAHCFLPPKQTEQLIFFFKQHLLRRGNIESKRLCTSGRLMLVFLVVLSHTKTAQLKISYTALIWA